MRSRVGIVLGLTALSACGGSTPGSPSSEPPIAGAITSVSSVESTVIAGSSSVAVPATEAPTTAVAIGPALPTQPPAPSTTIDPVLEEILAGLPLPPPSTITVPPLPSVQPPIFNPPVSIPAP